MNTLKTIIKDHITYRTQIFKLAKADLIKTYRGSALGWSWAIIKPAITIFVFWFAFSYGLRQGGDVNGFPYFLWLIAGFIPWFYMSEMLTGGAACMRTHKFMVTKMTFPISVIPTFVSLSKLSVHAILVAIMIVIFMLFGFMPDIYYLQIPLYMLMMFFFFTVWGLFAGLISAISKDFLMLVKSVTRAVFWISGIMYNIHAIDIPWVRFILSFNPITMVADGYRHCFIDKTWFFEDWATMKCYAIVMIVMIFLATLSYKKLYREIPDVM